MLLALGHRLPDDPGSLVGTVSGLGFLFWTVAYVLIIRQAAKDKSYGVPLLAVCLNITWEAYFAVVCPATPSAYGVVCSEASFLAHVGLYAWLLFDVAIFYQLIRYGRNQQWWPELRRYYYPIVAGTLLLAYLGQVGFVTFHGDTNGTEMAWISNLVMSALFVRSGVTRPGLLGLSYGAAWAKMVGTASFAIALIIGGMDQFDTDHPHWFLYFLFATVWAFDMFYIWILARRRSGAVPQGHELQPQVVMPAVRS